VRSPRQTCIWLDAERGSIAPLGIGLAGILLATVLTFANSATLLLFQQRETQQAEALALAVDQALTPDQLTAGSGLDVEAGRFAADAGITSFEVATLDGKTVTAKVCGQFAPPLNVPLVGIGGQTRVCATAKARRF